MAGGRYYRINHRIQAKEVRVIDQKGGQIGVLPLGKALLKARDQDLDLVEVAPKAKPPVCKITDFRRFLFQQKKKQKAGHPKSKKQPELKQIRLKLFIDDHDLQRIIKKTQGFLKKGDKVKFNLLLRGREVTKKELGFALLKKIQVALEGVATQIRPARLRGRFLEMTLRPIKNNLKNEKTKNEKSR